MRLLFLHLSDIHIKNNSKKEDFNIDKIVDALNSLDKVDDCIIVISGDITSSGKANEFKAAGYIIGCLIKELKSEKFKNCFINVVAVPGNHDLNFTEKISINEIIHSYETGTQDLLVDRYIKTLNSFYNFAKFNKCFDKDNIISYVPVLLKKYNISIGFTLINTSPFSLEGSANLDMGKHYLSKHDLAKIKPNCEDELNVVVMHHSVEWYNNEVKEELKKIFNSKYSIIFGGHEHDGFAEQRKSNGEYSLVYVQGNPLSGDKRHKKGFTTLVFDSDNKTVIGKSFEWEDNFFKPTTILNEKLQDKTIRNFEINKNVFKINKDFEEFLRFDDNKKDIGSYFIFPSLYYSLIDEEEEIEMKNLDNIDKLIDLILNNDRLIISGENRSGKTILTKVLYDKLLCSNYGIMPLYLESEDLNQKRLRNMEKIIKRLFNDQYKNENHAYEKFLQLETKQKLLFIDDANKLDKLMLDKILKLLDGEFGKVILLSEEKINIDIKDSVEEVLDNKKICKIDIRPFLYDKRKELITRVYCNLKEDEDKSKFKKEINNINNKINSQIRSFRLDPEFISDFVEQFSDNKPINQGNIFNVVYENSIKNKLISKVYNESAKNITGMFNVLGEIAYEMHFKKLTWIGIADISIIADAYNKRFRQKVKTAMLLRVGQDARLLVAKDNEYRFKDKNLKAYFVAQALNKKYHLEEENINDRLSYILDNLCFSINSNIMFFMAMITNNPKIIKLIMDKSSEYFDGKEEFSFDSKNISFIFNIDFKVKDNIPDENEQKDKEKELVKYEEDEIKYSEIIELIDEYDYNEKDVEMFENRVFKAIKYLEILSNILPSFDNIMEVEQQDHIVNAIYTFPNKLIYEWLKDIDDNFDNETTELYEKLSEMRKEKHISGIHIETVKKVVGQMGIYIILNLYQMISNLSSTEDSLDALNDFNVQDNTNYKLLNLMMVEKAGKFSEYSSKAVELYDKTDIKLIKSIVRFSVRNYLLNNDISLVGDGQAFLDKFFGSSDYFNNDKKDMKKHISKRRMKGV